MRVLITEDDQAIQLLLSRQIARWGYDVSTASDGEEALAAVRSEQCPDIIVMDWMMPKVSGIVACQEIKAMADLPLIYILMLTSKHERSDIVTGLNAGADDFLSKPVDSAELHSRLKVAERTISFERRLRSYAGQMEQLARQRADQLVHADRLAMIGTLSASIAHDVSSPLGAIMGNAELLQGYWRTLAPLLADVYGTAPQPEIKNILADVPEMLDSLSTSAQRIADLIKAIKRFYRRNDTAAREVYPLNDCVHNSLQVCWTKLKYEIDLEQNLAGQSPLVLAAPQQLDQVLVNLLMNAYEAITVQGAGKGVIRISTAEEDGVALLRVFNDGPAIPDEVLERIWQAFFTTKQSGTGLGLSISTGIIREHEGKIEARNMSGGGVEFVVHLPAYHVPLSPSGGK